jgi:membrane protease YdiL (CAAX protease family)
VTSVVHHILVLFLVLIFPVWDRWETRRLRAHSTPATRIRSYQKTMGWLWIATIVLLVTTPSTLLFKAPADARLDFARSSLGLPLVLGLCIGIALPVLLAWMNPKVRARQASQLGNLAFFAPQGARERAWFVGVALSAGFCEEVIFRGFLIRYLTKLLGDVHPAMAVVLAALVFGLDHGYQGWMGILTTAILALLFSFLFISSGTLWLPIMIHALFDLRFLLLSTNASEPPSPTSAS